MIYTWVPTNLTAVNIMTQADNIGGMMMFLLQFIVFLTLSVLRVFASKITSYANVDVILTGAQLLRPYNTIFCTPSSKYKLRTVQIFTYSLSAFLLCLKQYFKSENSGACLRFVYK